MKLNNEKIEKFGKGEITLAEVMNVTSRQKAALCPWATYSTRRDAWKMLQEFWKA